jgi:hypothetical protein
LPRSDQRSQRGAGIDREPSPAHSYAALAADLNADPPLERTGNKMSRDLLSYLDSRSCWRDATFVFVLSLAAAATASFMPNGATAQGNRTKVTFTVEFSTSGLLIDA